MSNSPSDLIVQQIKELAIDLIYLTDYTKADLEADFIEIIENAVEASKWCRSKATVVTSDASHTWQVKCILVASHNDNKSLHQWTTYMPESTWSLNGAMIRIP